MKRLLYLLLAATTLVAASCSKDDDHNSTRPTPQPDTIPTPEPVNIKTLKSVDSSAIYTPRQLMEGITVGGFVVNEIGDDSKIQLAVKTALNAASTKRRLAMDSLFTASTGNRNIGSHREWHIESHTFTYTSLSASGEPIELSGRVTFPNASDGNGHTLQSLSLYVHYFSSNNDKMPSRSLAPIDIRSMFNSAVISPDLEGYGVSVGRPYCGFSFAAEARQLLDCALAAIEVMQQHGVSLAADGYTTAWGYSLGAPVIASFVRLYDETLNAQQQQMFRLKSAYLGGGPMMLDRFVRYLDENPSYGADALHYNVSFLAALNPTEFGSYKLSDFLPEWMMTYMIDYNGEQLSFFDAISQGKGIYYPYPDDHDDSDIHSHFAPDMFDTTGHLNYSNPKTITLYNTLSNLSNWGTWQPQEDIFQTHHREDDYMPIAQARAFYESKRTSDHAYFKTVESGLAGIKLTPHHSSTLNALIISALYEDPATAFKHSL